MPSCWLAEGGRDQIGTLAAIRSERWPRSNRNAWPPCVGIRNHAAGELLFGPNIVEDQLAMTSQGLGDFLHGLDPRAHRLLAPIVEKAGGPGWRAVIPEASSAESVGGGA